MVFSPNNLLIMVALFSALVSRPSLAVRIEIKLADCGQFFRLLAPNVSQAQRAFWQDLVLPADSSWSVKFPELTAKFLDVHEGVASFRDYFLGGLKTEALASDLLEFQRSEQNKLAVVLQTIVRDFVNQELKKHSLDGSSNVRGIYSPEIAVITGMAKELQGLIRSLTLYSPEEAKALGLELSHSEMARWQEYSKSKKDTDWMRLKGRNVFFISKSLAYWGAGTARFWEIARIAFRLPQLQTLNRNLAELPSHFRQSPRSLRALLNTRPLAEWKTPIAMTWLIQGTHEQAPEDRIWAWGDVKTLKRPLHDDESFSHEWQKFEFHIQTNRESARRLGYNVCHVLFLPTGLTRKAKERLETLGYDEVRGVLVD